MCFFRGQLTVNCRTRACPELWTNASSFMQFVYVLPASVGFFFSYIIIYSPQDILVKANWPGLVTNLQGADEQVGGHPEKWRVHSVPAPGSQQNSRMASS